MSNQIEEATEAKSENTKKQKNSKNKRRFSDEQIKLLESIFELETKLEPRKKLQLAGELGLQPRQIAIWFQNKRARWKSKQIEQEYRTLRANYEKLASCFASLKNERQSLIIQLQKLNKLLGRPCEEGNRQYKDLEECNTASATDNYGFVSSDIEAKQGLDKTKFICSPDIRGRDIVDECTDASLVSTDQWYRLDSGAHFDLTSSSSQWFNFWT